MVNKTLVIKDERISTEVFSLMRFKYEKFNPIQSAFLKTYAKNANKLIAAATSAGKTAIAEMAIVNTIEVNRKQAIYIGPLKALVQEKIDEWSKSSHPFSKYKIAIATGDYVLPEKRKKTIMGCFNSDIALLTPELMDSLTRHIKNVLGWFQNVGVVVVDEAHLLTVKDRGSALESALIRFSMHSDAQIIFLSATMTNTEELAEWLSTLNKKPTYLIESDWRPCNLDVWYEPFNDFGDYNSKIDNLTTAVVEIIEKYPSDKFLVFVHTKLIGRKIQQILKHNGIEAYFHNADLNLEDRLKLSKLFMERTENGLRVLIATSTLAWGINMPARRVIIAGTQRGIEDVSVIDIKQMAGRAGRVGFDPKGDVYVLYPESKAEDYVGMLEDLSRMVISSRLKDQDELAFHIINEINEGRNTFDLLWEWYKRSFAVYCGETTKSTLRYVLDDLVSWGIAKETNGVYILSLIGKAAAWFYYSPYMVAILNNNFKKLNSNAQVTDIAWAIGTALPEYPVSVDIKYEAKAIFSNYEIPKNKYGNCYALYLLLTGNHENKLDMLSLIRSIQSDSQRLGATLKALDGFYNYSYDVSTLALRMQYGTPEHLLPLCKIKGIGAVRARKLYEAGIRNINDIFSNIDKAKQIIKNKTVITEIVNQNHVFSSVEKIRV